MFDVEDLLIDNFSTLIKVPKERMVLPNSVPSVIVNTGNSATLTSAEERQ